MPRIRSSGANGCPLTRPIAASCPARSASNALGGSSRMSSASSSKNEKALLCTVFITISAEVDELIVRWGWFREGVDPGLSHRGNAAQGAKDHPVGKCGASVGVVAVGEGAVVSGWHEEIFPAGAPVGARD